MLHICVWMIEVRVRPDPFVRRCALETHPAKCQNCIKMRLLLTIIPWKSPKTFELEFRRYVLWAPMKRYTTHKAQRPFSGSILRSAELSNCCIKGSKSSCITITRSSKIPNKQYLLSSWLTLRVWKILLFSRLDKMPYQETHWSAVDIMPDSWTSA